MPNGRPPAGSQTAVRFRSPVSGDRRMQTRSLVSSGGTPPSRTCSGHDLPPAIPSAPIPLCTPPPGARAGYSLLSPIPMLLIHRLLFWIQSSRPFHPVRLLRVADVPTTASPVDTRWRQPSSTEEATLPIGWWYGLSRHRDCSSKAFPVSPWYLRLPKLRGSDAPWPIDVGTGGLNPSANLSALKRRDSAHFSRPAPRGGRQGAAIFAAPPPSSLSHASHGSAWLQRCTCDTNGP